VALVLLMQKRVAFSCRWAMR